MICTVVGARPNYMKMAPVVEALQARQLPYTLVHTGQHYDRALSDVFFEELNMPRPDFYLGIGSDSHARQTARIMTAFEEVCQQIKPDMVVVSGDVNSTLATALVAAKLHIPVAHVEAGLRSFDRSMPEEINRILTDRISDWLFTTEASANKHLIAEGHPESAIYFVGNCMVDTLLKHRDRALQEAPWESFHLLPGQYALLTLHRPSNVDHIPTLRKIMEAIQHIAREIPILFPVHPRTRKRLAEAHIECPPSVHLVDPLPYLTFLGLMAKARMVLTDSGGIQEETTILNIPCLTLRENTERPVTIELGTNELVGTDPHRIIQHAQRILSGQWKTGTTPPLWDGQAGTRIAAILEETHK